MKVHVDVGIVLSPSRGATISFEPGLEVSLDCTTCGRTHRTVVFDSSEAVGRCTPDGHTFDGMIGHKKVAVSGLWRKTYSCVIPLSYEYQPVTDKKHPARASSPTPTWARVHFAVTCPSCGHCGNLSTQNNIVRPYTCSCSCGTVLYTETASQPTFTVRDA